MPHPLHAGDCKLRGPRGYRQSKPAVMTSFYRRHGTTTKQTTAPAKAVTKSIFSRKTSTIVGMITTSMHKDSNESVPSVSSSDESSATDEEQSLGSEPTTEVVEDDASLMSSCTKRDASHLKSDDSVEGPKAKKQRRRWRKPAGKPKRPLSAYNLYFREERERMAKQNKGPKRGFRDMAKLVAVNWNKLDAKHRAKYEVPAEEERKKYFTALAKWKQEQKKKQKDEVFEKQMETYYDTFSSCQPEIDVSANTDPLPLPISSHDVPFIDRRLSLGGMASAEKRLSLGGVTSQLPLPAMPMFDSPLFANTQAMMPPPCVPDTEAMDSNPTMKRILATFDTLGSHVDEEFVGFMTGLDWGNSTRQH